MSLLPPASLPAHSIVVLLVDDQAIIGEAVRRMLAGEPDIVLHFCQDPTAALAKAEEIRPTLILQDLVMPDLDGLTMVKTFRANTLTQEVPLIVLSSKEEPKVKAEAFALGANDYLVKLPDKVELIARIRHHSQGYINLLERNEAYRALSASQAALAEELAEAADYVRSILPARLEGEIASDWKFITSTSLGGDAFGYRWLDGEHFAMYLLDVCGHGVGAALLSVSAMNVLTSGQLKGVDFTRPAEVLQGLNEAFPMEKQNNMYFTIWYGIFHKPTRRLRYSSGGHPPAVVVGGGAPARLRTPGMVIGGMPGAVFKVDEAEVPAGARLYIFSDGTYEVKHAATGKMMDIEEFVAVLAREPRPGLSKLDSIVAEVREIQAAEHFVDDFSIIELAL